MCVLNFWSFCLALTELALENHVNFSMCLCVCVVFLVFLSSANIVSNRKSFQFLYVSMCVCVCVVFMDFLSSANGVSTRKSYQFLYVSVCVCVCGYVVPNFFLRLLIG